MRDIFRVSSSISIPRVIRLVSPILFIFFFFFLPFFLFSTGPPSFCWLLLIGYSYPLFLRIALSLSVGQFVSCSLSRFIPRGRFEQEPIFTSLIELISATKLQICGTTLSSFTSFHLCRGQFIRWYFVLVIFGLELIKVMGRSASPIYEFLSAPWLHFDLKYLADKAPVKFAT